MSSANNNSKSSYLSWIIAALLFSAIIILFVQNAKDVTLTIFWQSATIPLNLLLISCTLIGLFLGLILILPGRWKLSRANKKLLKAQKEIDQKDLKFISTSKNK